MTEEQDVTVTREPARNVAGSFEWGAVGSQDVEVAGGVAPYGEFLVVFVSVVFSAHGCAVSGVCDASLCVVVVVVGFALCGGDVAAGPDTRCAREFDGVSGVAGEEPCGAEIDDGG